MGQHDEAVRAITDLIFVRHAPRHVDLALVLGSPTVSSMDPAVALYRGGLVRRIVISGLGRHRDGPPEWQMLRDYGLEQGIAAGDMLIEPEATNTLENIRLSAPLIEREIGWSAVSTLAICCKPLHTRRAMMTARTHLPSHVEIVMLSPCDPRDIQPESWWTNDVARDRVLLEMKRIADYTLKGDITLG